jgi:hypothetical protein
MNRDYKNVNQLDFVCGFNTSNHRLSMITCDFVTHADIPEMKLSMVKVEEMVGCVVK